MNNIPKIIHWWVTPKLPREHIFIPPDKTLLLREELGIGLKENILLARFATLEIGGPSSYFFKANSKKSLIKAVKAAKTFRISFIVIGSGSNLLIHDNGYEGLIIKNNIKGIKIKGSMINPEGGVLLQTLVDKANENGLSGLERLTGIPGTVAGAIYGNAGAYGQTISDNLTRVGVTDGDKTFWLSKKECGFQYRESIFKKQKDLIILKAEFELVKGNSVELKKTSEEIADLRRKKYLLGIRCPGSFFKNVLLEKLPKHLQNDMPEDYYGKVPAWYFLEEVGAKGQKRGDIKIADFHANLFINEGGGKASDFFELAKEYKEKVKEKFGITLEPEVQLVGFQKLL